MTTYSQNDPAWKSQKHGTSNSTIGATGCTITALTMMLTSIGYNENPKTVNQKLTENSGYANGNLIIWSAINNIWPRAKFQWRGYSYTDDDNAKVADAIAKYGSCLVAVNGAPIGGAAKDGHWVLYIGNKKLVDPWDGKEKATSTYSATGYAIIELTGSDVSEISIPTKTFEELVGKASKYDDFKNNGYENASQVKEKLSSLESRIESLEETTSSLNQLVTEKNAQIAKMQGQISTLTQQLLEATTRVKSLEDQAKKVPELETQVSHLTDEKAKWTESEKTFNRIIGQLRADNEALRSRAIPTLLKVAFENIVSSISKKLGISKNGKEEK